jgi:hypothetical protein
MLRLVAERSMPLRPHFTTVVVSVGTFVAALANPCGKTTLALHIIAEAQKAGGLAAFIDAEHGTAPEGE